MLVNRAVAELALGYARGSLRTVMRKQPGRWPGPVACRLDGRILLWDLDELRAADHRGEQVGANSWTVSDPDGLITCLECGRRFRSLGPHLARAHQLPAREYRARHQLPATAALTSDNTRASLRDQRLQALAQDPTLLDHLRAWPTPRGPRTVPGQVPVVREHRRGTDHLRVAASARVRARRREERAQAAGYDTWATAVEATRELTRDLAAAQLGCGTTTITQWRARLAPPDRPRGKSPRAAGSA